MDCPSWRHRVSHGRQHRRRLTFQHVFPEEPVPHVDVVRITLRSGSRRTDRSSRASTPSSARSRWRCAGRSGCSPVPAPARPGRSPTGSPTAWPPASTTPPRSSRSPSRPAPPARCAPGCASLGAQGVQARTFHSAALRQARYFWPRVYGGELPQLMDSKLPARGHRRPAQPGRHPAGDAARPGQRDRVGQGQQRPSRRLRPGRGRPSGREVTGVDAATVARVFASYEEAKRDGRPDGHGGRAALRGRRARRGRAGRRRGAPAVPPLRRRRVPGRQPDPVRAARPVARRPRTSSAWSATPRRRSTPSPGASARYLLDFPRQAPRHHERRAGPQLPVHPAGGRGGEHAARRQRHPGRAARARSSDGRARRSRYREHPDEVDEAEAVAAEIRTARSTPAPRPSEIAVLFRINAQSEAFEEALAARGVPYVVRGAERFFQRAEVRQAVTLLRGSARSAEGGGGRGDELVEQTQGRGRRHGLDARGARRPGQRPRPLGVAAGAHRPRGRASPRRRPEATLGDFVDDLDRRAAEQHAPVAEGVTIATLHAAKGLEWDAVFLCGVVEGTLPITYADGLADGGRGGAPAALRRHDPRPARAVGVVGAGPQPGRPRLPPPLPLPRRPAPARSPRTGRREPARRVEVQGQAVRVPGVRGPLGSAAERKVGRCDGCPSTYDEALFERAAGLAVGDRQGRVGAGVRRLHRPDPPGDRRGPAGDRPSSCCAINGIGRTKQEKYGDAVLALLAGRS